MESEKDLEEDNGEEPQSDEESVVEDDDDQEVVDQEDDEEEEVVNDEEDDENEVKKDKDAKATAPTNQKDKAQTKPTVPAKTELSKPKPNPLHSQTPITKSKREQQIKTKASLMTETNQGAKSIFTKITESIFQSYLNTEEGHKPKAYDFLISEDYLARIKDQDNKDNKGKFNDMLDRQDKFLVTVDSKRKQRQERQQEELKSKCTWTPSGTKTDVKVRNPAEFYTDQLRFLEDKKTKIQSQKDHLDANTKNNMTAVPLISMNSKKIAETKNPNENEEDFLKRLKNEKLKTVKEKMIKKEEKEKEKEAKTPQPKTKKKTLSEMNELVSKLHGENEKMHKTVDEERKKKMAQEIKRENNFITDSTKKIFLDRLVNSYEKALLELFNTKDNFAINFESYCSLMSKIGFTLHYNQKSSEHPALIKLEEELLKESFGKYLNPKDERIDTHFCLLFFLCIIGIYKGKNYRSEQQQDQSQSQNQTIKAKEESHNKKTIEEENKQVQKKKRTPEEFIHLYIPELDLEKYQLSISTITFIKTRYRLFYDNLSFVWSQEVNNKKKDKQSKGINIMASTLDKSNNTELKTVTKYNNFKETTRKKIIDKALEEIDPNINAKGLKIEEVYSLRQKKKENELVELRNQKEKEDLKECTFQPNAQTKKINKDISANIEKLYTDGKVTYQKKLQSEDYKKTIENRELEQCTFKPDIHLMNESIRKNPLEQDTQLKNKIESLKKKDKTAMGNTELRNYNDPMPETVPTMRFDMEKKTFKDTFNNYENRNKANTFNNSIRNSKKVEKQKPVPLLNIEVNIDDNNQIVKLEIFPGDDPIKIAEEFCLKHGLSNDKKEKLQRIIQEKLNEAIGDNNSASQP